MGREIYEKVLSWKWDVEIDFVENDSLRTYNLLGKIDAEGTDEAILVAGHYDGWWVQSSIDNAVGAATMLGIAERFSKHKDSIKLKYDLIFAAFAGEEYSMRGSGHFAATTSKNIKIMINLDKFAQKDSKTKLYYFCANETLQQEVQKVVNATGNSDYCEHWLSEKWPHFPGDNFVPRY